MNEDKEMVPVSQLREAEARAERAEKDRDDYCLLAQINNSKQVEAEGRELEWQNRAERAEAEVELMLVFVRNYAYEHPKWVYEGNEQDPMGAHAILAAHDAGKE